MSLTRNSAAYSVCSLPPCGGGEHTEYAAPLCVNLIGKRFKCRDALILLEEMPRLQRQVGIRLD